MDDGRRQRHPDPRENLLLASLPANDYLRLVPHLELVELPAGLRLHDAGRRESDLYFLTDGTVSRGCVTSTGECLGFALTGREGVVGVASLLSGEGTSTEATVVGAGRGYRLRADVLKSEFQRVGVLRKLLLGYVGDLMAQTGQSAVCNRFHSLAQRLGSWLLSSLDRSGSSEIRITHGMLALLLGVRREGVTQALAGLCEAGVVRGMRGRIVVLDRVGLEASACECYAVLEGKMSRPLRRRHRSAVAGYSAYIRPNAAAGAIHVGQIAARPMSAVKTARPPR